MKANVLFGIGDLKYTNIPLPRLKSDEVFTTDYYSIFYR